MKFKRVLALSIVLGFIFAASAFAQEHMKVEVTSVNFSNSGNELLIFANIINDGDVDLNLTKVVFTSFRVQDEDMTLYTDNITADNLDIFVKADHYIEYTFKLNITNAMRRYFISSPRWDYRYNIFWRRSEDDYEDEDDYEEDEEDENF